MTVKVNTLKDIPPKVFAWFTEQTGKWTGNSPLKTVAINA